MLKEVLSDFITRGILEGSGYHETGSIIIEDKQVPITSRGWRKWAEDIHGDHFKWPIFGGDARETTGWAAVADLAMGTDLA